MFLYLYPQIRGLKIYKHSVLSPATKLPNSFLQRDKATLLAKCGLLCRLL